MDIAPGPEEPAMSTISVRYTVDYVDAAIDFYTRHPGSVGLFESSPQPVPANKDGQ